MKDEHLVAEFLEPLSRSGHARGRDAEHRGYDQRSSWPTGAASAPAAIPTSAPAAFTRICVGIGSARRCRRPSTSSSRPSDRSTRCVSPDAAVETISFGTPIGSLCIAWVAMRRPAGASECPDRVEPPLGVEPQHDLRCTAGHRLDGRAPVSSVRQRLHVDAGRCRHLLSGDVRLGERLAEDARVDQQYLRATLSNAVAEVARTPRPSCPASPRRTTVVLPRIASLVVATKLHDHVTTRTCASCAGVAFEHAERATSRRSLPVRRRDLRGARTAVGTSSSATASSAGAGAALPARSRRRGPTIS